MHELSRALAEPPAVAGLERASPMHGLDRRTLGWVDVLGQSVSAAAPAAAATTIPLLIAGAVGDALMLCVGVALVVVLLVSSSINQFTRRVVSPGSLYTFVAKGLGPTPAFVTAIGMLVGYGFISMFALAGGGYYLGLLLRGGDDGGPAALSAALVALLSVVTLVVLVVGVRISTRVTLVIESLSVVAITGLVVALLHRLGTPDLAAAVPSALTPGGLAVGSALAITGFVGFESAVTLGVETRRPRATVPRVLTRMVAGAGVLYLLAAYSQQVGFASLGRDLAASASPVNDLTEAYGVAWLGWVLDVSITASFLACAVASSTALVRVLFGLARDGVLPDALGQTHPRFRTPWVATSLSVPVIAAVPLTGLLLGADLWWLMRVLIVGAAAGYITSYLLVCAAVPPFLHRIGEWTAPPVAVATAAAGSLTVLLGAYLATEATDGGAAGATGVALFVVVTAAGLSWWRRMRRRSPAPADIGLHDRAISTDVLGRG